MEKTPKMEIINDFMTEIDGDRWGENSANELAYLLSMVATFDDLDAEQGETTLKFVDVGDKKVALAIYTLTKDTEH